MQDDEHSNYENVKFVQERLFIPYCRPYKIQTTFIISLRDTLTVWRHFRFKWWIISLCYVRVQWKVFGVSLASLGPDHWEVRTMKLAMTTTITTEIWAKYLRFSRGLEMQQVIQRCWAAVTLGGPPDDEVQQFDYCGYKSIARKRITMLTSRSVQSELLVLFVNYSYRHLD
jgi:hypothetical protein